jgi:hypothetical protein
VLDHTCATDPFCRRSHRRVEGIAAMAGSRLGTFGLPSAGSLVGEARQAGAMLLSGFPMWRYGQMQPTGWDDALDG